MARLVGYVKYRDIRLRYIEMVREWESKMEIESKSESRSGKVRWRVGVRGGGRGRGM